MLTPTPFGLRAAAAADLPAVIDLIRALADFERLPGPDEAAAARLTADFLATPPRFELLVAERDGRVIAYALHFMTYSTFLSRPSLYLEDLFVHPAARSGGIGRALLLRLAAIAAARGCGRFEWLGPRRRTGWVATVLDWNERAHSFYRSLGARLLPEWRVCRLDGEALATLADAGGEGR